MLKKHPLTKAEIDSRRRGPEKKDRGMESKFYHTVRGAELSRKRKGQIAESAVLFRLALHGFDTFGAVFDNDRIDWLVQVPNGLVRLQVKWARHSRTGLPHMSLMCANGSTSYRRYRLDEFDFLVGYDLFSDTAYVFSSQELVGKKTAVAVSPDAAERWDKLCR